MKIAPILVMVDDGGVFGIVVIVCLTTLKLFWGNPRFGSLGSGDDDAFGVDLPDRAMMTPLVSFSLSGALFLSRC